MEKRKNMDVSKTKTALSNAIVVDVAAERSVKINR